MYIFIISCSVAVIVSFFCSLAEAVFLSLNPVRMETLKREGKGYAGLWLSMRKNMGRPIAAILILNTVAHTGGATVAGGAFAETYGEEWIWLFSILFTIVILLGTEILPKVLGVSYNEKLVPFIAPVLKIAIIFMGPFIWVSEAFSNLFIRKKGQAAGVTIEDIRTIAQMAKTENLIGTRQESIIVNVARLKNITMGSIMIPAEAISMIPVGLSLTEALVRAHLDMHTRFPVCSQDDNAQSITGYVNLKDIIYTLHINPADPGLKAIVRPIKSFDVDMNVLTVMEEMMQEGLHIGVVKEGDGVISGMVTLEDILEQVVGQILDEYDKLPTYIHPYGPGWIMGGGVSLDKIAQVTGINIKRQKEPAPLLNTLAQWCRYVRTGGLRGAETFDEGGLTVTPRKFRRKQVLEAFVAVSDKKLH
ncbi:MAG: CNNM domain-containing protein [Candidatus Omnitrophica bacterium]|nr:CNNM domain-containing protein [Patescibacteria group bacterium]MDD5775632.1 CNNM domain-containing protein [Candidatus Omnitrophota bacterium]